MVASKRVDFQAVWLVMSRQIQSKLEFWLLLIASDQQERSISYWLYQVYLVVFFTIWGLAMLTLLADFASDALLALPLISPLSASVWVGAIALLAFFLVELFVASRRSPFVFSEADAHLLCRTPVDRRILAIIWFLKAWLSRGLIIWPASVVLGYALLEAQTASELTFAHLPLYLLAGLRMLVVIIPLHLAIHSLAWAVGAWRLHGNRDLAALRWSAPVLAVLLLASCISSVFISGFDLESWSWLLVYPLQAGLGAASLPAGLGLAVALAILGVFLLWAFARNMSLARASQETRGLEALQAARWTMAFDLEGELKQVRRLGTGRKPSRLPVRPGAGALLWRNAIRSLRSFTIRKVFMWFWVIGLTLSLLLIPDWWTRILLFAFWLFTLGNLCIHYLKTDLSNWWLMRQLPFRSEKIILVDIILPLVGIGLNGSIAFLTAYLLGTLLGLQIHPILPWLFFPGIVGIALAAAVDILLHVETDRLLEGNPASLSLLTILMGALAIVIPGGSGWLALNYLNFPIWSGVMIALAVSIGLDYSLYRWAGKLIVNIK